MRSLRIAACQMTSTEDLASNLAKVLSNIAIAARGGSQVVAFPENCLFLGSRVPGAELALEVTLGAAPDTDGALRDVCAAAHTNAIDVLLPIVERGTGADAGCLYNTALWISRDGRVQHRYRKIHVRACRAAAVCVACG